jgi:hypothetical protein
MGSFKRALFGYRRSDVDAAMVDREAQIANLQKKAADAVERWQREADGKAGAEAEIADLSREAADLSAMVLEREREIRVLSERLLDAHSRHERSIASLESVASHIDEIHSQARGQATRIRMKALREAVEVGRRAQELADASTEVEEIAAPEPPSDLFEGPMRLEIGPLGDFSQLVGIEDAISRIGGADISVERFSEGRATLSMNLEEPVELLRELEESAPMEFRVRRNGDDSLILDVDEEQGPGRQAA